MDGRGGLPPRGAPPPRPFRHAPPEQGGGGYGPPRGRGGYSDGPPRGGGGYGDGPPRGGRGDWEGPSQRGGYGSRDAAPSYDQAPLYCPSRRAADWEGLSPQRQGGGHWKPSSPSTQDGRWRGAAPVLQQQRGGYPTTQQPAHLPQPPPHQPTPPSHVTPCPPTCPCPSCPYTSRPSRPSTSTPPAPPKLVTPTKYRDQWGRPTLKSKLKRIREAERLARQIAFFQPPQDSSGTSPSATTSTCQAAPPPAATLPSSPQRPPSTQPTSAPVGWGRPPDAPHEQRSAAASE